MRPGRSTRTSSTGMTCGLVGVGMRSTSWKRPGSPRKLLGICLLGVVSLVVSVRHLFLGDLFLLFLFPCCCFCCLFPVLGFCRFSFFFCCYFCCVITMSLWSRFLVVFLWFSGWVLVLGNLVSLFLLS